MADNGQLSACASVLETLFTILFGVYTTRIDPNSCGFDRVEVGIISIQKSHAWKMTISERGLLEKLGFNREHWWLLDV